MYQVSSILRNVGVFAHTCLYMKTARLATTLGSLRRDRMGVQDHPSLGALGAVCRVLRVYVPCIMRCFFSKKEQAAGPNSLVSATLCLRTRVRARHAFFFFREPFFPFFLPFVF